MDISKIIASFFAITVVAAMLCILIQSWKIDKIIWSNPYAKLTTAQEVAIARYNKIANRAFVLLALVGITIILMASPIKNTECCY